MHAADLTGREVERALLAAARANPNIMFYEHHLGVDLVMGEANGVPHCFGVDVLDQRANAMIRCIAPVTMLATGGGGQVRSTCIALPLLCVPIRLVVLDLLAVMHGSTGLALGKAIASTSVY